MTCHFCKQPGKRFRNIAIDEKHVAPWCQKCPDPRYKPRGKQPEPPKVKETGEMSEHTVDLDQEYEILHPTEFYGQKVRESIGTVFARNAREAISLARAEFGKGLGKLFARPVS